RTEDECFGELNRGITRRGEGFHILANRVSLGIRRHSGRGRLWQSRRSRGHTRCFSSHKHGSFSCIAPTDFSTSVSSGNYNTSGHVRFLPSTRDRRLGFSAAAIAAL